MTEANEFRRSCVQNALAVLCCAAICCHISVPKAGATGPANAKLPIGPDWSLLDFQNGRAIQKASIIIGSGPTLAGERVINATVSIDDPGDLARIATGCSNALRPLGLSAESASGDTYYAELRIVPTSGPPFSIYLFAGAFVLQDDVRMNNNYFYSWKLAKVIDDVLKRNGHDIISNRRFDWLSGQGRLDADKKASERLPAQQ